MDHNLYIKLAAVTKFFEKEYRLTQKYQKLDGDMNEMISAFVCKKESEEEGIRNSCIFAILPLVTGVVFSAGFLGIILGVTPVDWRYATTGELLMVAGLGLFATIIVGFGTITLRNALKRKRNLESNFQKLWEDEYEPKYNTMSKELNDIEANVKKMHNDFDELLAFLPQKYQNFQATAFMLMAIKDGRADTLKEAYNLYEEQLHRWKLEAAANRAAEMQQLVAMAIDELNSQQAETNAHLSAIEQYEFIKYIHPDQN